MIIYFVDYLFYWLFILLLLLIEFPTCQIFKTIYDKTDFNEKAWRIKNVLKIKKSKPYRKMDEKITKFDYN